MTSNLKPSIITALVKQALSEDVGRGDITTTSIAEFKQEAKAVIIVQADGVVAGLPLVREVFRQLDKKVRINFHQHDGVKVKAGMPLATITGDARAVLTGERTALNYLGLLSGIATTTDRYVGLARGSKTKILDTRKTIPGLRSVVKYAVTMGGGTNHRMGLYDAVLIKDNHLALAGSVTAAIKCCRKKLGKRQLIEVEVETLNQVKEALLNRADIILLDNFKLAPLKQALNMIGQQAQTEISGGVGLQRIKTYVNLGVDRISVGAITHSSPWLPVHMEFE